MDYFDSLLENWEIRIIPSLSLRKYLYGDISNPPVYYTNITSEWLFMKPTLPTVFSIVYLTIVFYNVSKRSTTSFLSTSSPSTLNTTPKPSSPVLNYIVVLHNIFLCLLSVYMSIETLLAAYETFGWKTNFRLFCNSMDLSFTSSSSSSVIEFTPAGQRLANVIYIHYLSKFYEYIDTFIMLYKGNYRQVSFLHVYHHVMTGFPIWYLNLKYNPGAECWLCCFLNSLVHVFMYAHYALTALKWSRLPKLYITLFQIIQFGIYLIQSTYLIINDCYRPMISVWSLFFNSVLFITLFIQFYRKESKEEKKLIVVNATNKTK